jgi:hypothetical protein
VLRCPLLNKSTQTTQVDVETKAHKSGLPTPMFNLS